MSNLADVLESALCAQVDLELFFPEKGGSSRPAKDICHSCPVQEECLQVALEVGVHGIWGGTSEQQRRKLGGRNPQPIWRDPTTPLPATG